MMDTQMHQLAGLMAQNGDAGAMGGAGQAMEGDNQIADYQSLLGNYQGARQRFGDAQKAGQLGGNLLKVGMATHPALALVGGLMAWKAKNSMKEAKEERSTAYDEIAKHDEFNAMDTLGGQQKRGLGERFKGMAGSLF